MKPTITQKCTIMVSILAGTLGGRLADAIGGAGGIITTLLPILIQIISSLFSGGIAPCIPKPTPAQLRQMLTAPNGEQQIFFLRHAKRHLRQNRMSVGWAKPIMAASKQVAMSCKDEEFTAMFQEATN